MVIHVVSTVNGQMNEGMRNVATHLSREFEKEHTVIYSSLKQITNIMINSKKADVTFVFARANKLVYELLRLVTLVSKNVWLVLVQKPDASFMAKNEKCILRCNYLSITESDLRNLKILPGRKKQRISVGIDKNKFTPVAPEQQLELKKKYGYDPERPLIVHVGHCSVGRGLEDFVKIDNAQRLIVASGMFEDAGIVKTLLEANINIYRGYIENIEEIYQMADVYLFPTKSAEYVISIPLSVTEALSCGVPVIGYQSFENLREIDRVEGAITLINAAEEINHVLPEVIRQKSSHSLLNHTESWKMIAGKVLRIVKEELQ